MLFDSHSHMYSKNFNQDREAVFKKIREAGVEYVLNAGADLETSLKACELSEKYDFFYNSVGCHPHDAKHMDDETLEMFRHLAKKEKTVAIGEIGLDYHYDHSDRETQKYWFEQQIQLALDLKMPIIIHDREANDDVLRILKKTKAFDTKVLLHCFSGSTELARQYTALGAMISIAGPITFKNARKAVEVVENIDLNHLLIETDAPYLTPEPFRGKRNDSSNVVYVAEKIAEIRNMSFEEIAKITMDNAKCFFDIK